MSHPNRARVSKLSLALIAALAAAPVFAQSTSAALGGRVVGADAQPIAGAEVTIVHTASGTVSKATTDANGRYTARGLRVGGPYTITVNKAGAGTDSEQGVYLELSESNNVDLSLASGAATTLETVTIVGTGISVFAPNAMGTGSNISRDQLDGFSSIKRDLQDYARMDPRMSQTDKERGEISAAGQNTRYNSITIDGVTTNDKFGIESNNLPTIRQPISIDTIDAVEVNVAKYDVTEKGYTGANINAVTKSGTNDFHGSAYYVYRDADMVGDSEQGAPFTGFKEDFSYGATFGGPLMKDRLFFFLNYEKSERTAPSPEFGPVGSGKPNIVNITQSQIDQVIAEARDKNLIPGSLVAQDLSTESESWLAKFDWNINDDHRASFRINHTEQLEAFQGNFSRNGLSLSSYWNRQPKEFDNYVAQLFSDWSENFSTEARLSYQNYQSKQPLIMARQPQIRVDFGSANLRLGTEQFRHANVIDNKTWNGYFAGNWYMGDHELKFGVDHEKNEIYNLFLDSGFGTYRFRSLTDFENGVYSEYQFRTFPAGGSLDDVAANFTLENTGLFVQDTWTLTPNLTLLFGVRADIPNVDEPPRFNAAASAAFGRRNDVTIDGNYLIQPRFGFNYTFDSERPTQLRGGIGLFQGSASNVWLTNPYTNNGQTIQVFGCGTGIGFTNSCTGAPPFLDANAPRPQIGTARQDVDFVEEDLHQPSVWKANLAFEHELPWYGMVASAELLLTSVNTGLYYEHLNLGGASRIGADGRNLYWGTYNTATPSVSGARANANAAYRDVLLARETNKGEGQNLTFSLSKPMIGDSHWYWQAAYSYTNATEVNPLTSSRSISGWQNRAVFNPNEEVSARSNYSIRHRVTAALQFKQAFWGDNDTSIALFYEGRTGKPYSWTFFNDMNGDGTSGNDLLYIPDNRDGVAFVSQADKDAFWNYVASHKEFNGAAGGAMERNSSETNWINNFDMRISQELPGFFEGNKAELWIDILNVGNLLNKKWGHIDEVGFDNNFGGVVRSPVDFVGINAQGQYVYDFRGDEALTRRDRTGESRWSLQVGFRYKF
ncbi:TonB-dependent receptor [Lysobacter sp. CFH 32150]|uniref:TonB-dependent receptor n=1 Tax=Lysobacter sp. CFH 32150 TaxID=2927128 RepID=UPI001FA781C8|nr:TonB-dependent receptor [Lysobacter sp. CFH 32150]MCI4566965.1 TonB-dependent receptor [Lysobacter sp. CFH 32150]